MILKVAVPGKVIDVLSVEIGNHGKEKNEQEHRKSGKDVSNKGKRVIIKYRDKNGKVKKELGVVIDEVHSPHTEISRNILKADEVIFPDEIPFLTENMITVAKKVAEKYICDIFEVLSLFSPPSFLKLEVKIKEKNEEAFRKERAKKIYSVLKKKRKISISQAVKISKWEKIISLEEKDLIQISPAKKEMRKKEVGEWFSKKIKREENLEEDKWKENLTLTDEQEKALLRITSDSKYRKFLIHGATGSGKTEVYLRAISKIISEGKRGRSAIYLLPEISLTTFLLERIKSRFPDAVVLHSGIPEREREMNWWALRYGISRVAVGARSCVFAPCEKLGIIVVDEEHDSSYKQSPDSTKSHVFYDARYVAEVRAEVEDAKVVFGSATPSINTYFRAKYGDDIKLIEMKNRVKGMKFPKTRIVDLRKSELDDFLSFPLSEELRSEIQKRIERKENIILLFTRRGWALSVICEECSFKFKCNWCDTSLTYHKKGLLCHWCGKEYPIPSACPNCSSEKLGIIGFGTERIEEELKDMFGIPVFRMDSDIVRNEKHAREILEKFGKTSPAILLGTQMVAKGFDFPKVSLVGVILADTEFLLPDFRADERAFQLITQVAGRAGRKIKEDGSEHHEDISIIQTFSPDYPAIKYAVEGGYTRFFEMEIEKRKEFGLPPFRDIVLITFTGKDEALCWSVADDFSKKIKNLGLEHEPPTKSARYLVSGKYNVKIPVYVSPTDENKLRKLAKKSVFFLKGVKIKVDVAPDTVL